MGYTVDLALRFKHVVPVADSQKGGPIFRAGLNKCEAPGKVVTARPPQRLV